MTETFTQDTIALVYDFDGTLSPQAMQEYTVLPKLKIAPKDFWAQVNCEHLEHGEEKMLAYMRLLCEEAEKKKIHIGREEFRELGQNVRYFEGVEAWFLRMNAFVKAASDNRVKLRHYVISAGLKEILEGVSIAPYFEQIFASEYHYNHHHVATFPKILVTDTSKTQFLFRINKGKEKLTDSINTHMPLAERPIPFQNLIYIGDGETDVPSMTVTRHNGGNAIAVYKPSDTKTYKTCRDLLKADRVNFIAEANYETNSVLEKRVKLLLQSVIARIAYQRELFACHQETGA